MFVGDYREDWLNHGLSVQYGEKSTCTAIPAYASGSAHMALPAPLSSGRSCNLYALLTSE
ncbi:hypothetical protein NECAME_03551 [Necator americanus]|uniref:Uncharacterized protein n=1 Tax=Necator americanus TaxID=51031 RepID=W2T2N9_NECAM|nr:hypothetical protein NECAME_03551 [Necator americanus]ETN76178.1 hypothetical protein NECAME_03551 [Necator americanus]